MFTNRTLTVTLTLAMTLMAMAQAPRTERLPGQEPTDIRYSENRRGIATTGSTDSLIEIRNLEIRTYVDTLRIISMHTDTIDRTAQQDPNDRRGHYVELHVGGGIGSVTGLGTKQHTFIGRDILSKDQNGRAEATEKGGLSGMAQLQYVCFFHPSVGVGIGAWLANYTSYGTINGSFVYPRSAANLDSDHEPYEHHADIKQWRERQTVHTVGIPVSLQFQGWGKKRGAAGFFFDLGVAPVYTMVDCPYMTNYHVLGGEIEHWGKYPQWGNTDGGPELHEARDFRTIGYAGQKGKLTIKQFTATAFFDIGLLIRMSRHTDLLLGVYGHYTFLDIQQAKAEKIGWKTEDFPNVNMAPYNGMLAGQWQEETTDANGNITTNYINGTGALPVRPIEAGVKIGLHWHTQFKPKHRQSYEQHLDTVIQLAQRVDTVVSEHVETITRAEHVQHQVDKLNRIYFSFDSYTLNEDSKQFLAAIARQLSTIPNKIIIGGHASKEGTQRHNEQLALNRALAVRRYLISLGIDAKRMIAKEYGSSVPNAINTGNEMSLDRRVEIIVVDDTEHELKTY